MKAQFGFDPRLHPFLEKSRRVERFGYECARAATLKNAIEALGVPHTEVGALTVNGEAATLQRIVREGDVVQVEIRTFDASPDLRFVADAHLGGLARFLRMLGFDTRYENDFADAAIRRLALDEGRVVLTRDRELLKCREIERGAYVRALKAEGQLREVAERFRLAAHARPFTLCLKCNLPLRHVDRAEVAAHLPQQVRELHERYMQCRGCGGVFWPGSHYQRMRHALRCSLPT